jgi:CRISPR-associated protein Csd2
MSHTYHFSNLWNGKVHDAVVTERHDIVLLFDATNCNPNGDPDTGNMPRLQPDTLRGLVTDVCLKRKVRNFWGLYPPAARGYDIFIRESAILGNVTTSSHLALLEDRCFGMLDRLRAEGFLSAESHQEVVATLKTVEKKEWPQKSEGCEQFVSKSCMGKCDYTPLLGKLAEALAVNAAVPQEVRGALSAVKLSEEQRTDPGKTWKAVEKACGDSFPKDIKSPQKKLALKLVKDAFEGNAPESLLADFAKNNMEKANRDALCKTYADVRSFGAVVSTDGPLEGSFYGQIRGPLQITFAESLDKILQLDFSVTRCAIASEPKKRKEAESAEPAAEASDNRTMGRKHAVPYALYRCHIHFSPAFAAKTHFTYADLDNFLFALTCCLGDFNVDGSSARPGGMRVVGLVDFQHQSSLGHAPAHALFDLVKVEGIKFTTDDATAQNKPDLEGKFKYSGSEFPQGLRDYTGSAPDGPIYTETNAYGIVIRCTDKQPRPKDGNPAASNITARRLLWKWDNQS